MKKLLTFLCALTLSAALAPPALAGQPALQPGDLLGSTGADGLSLVTIDPTTGASALRCDLSAYPPITEIAYRADGTLFATTGSGDSEVLTIDPDTCDVTPIGTHAFGAVNGLAFVGNTLYGSFYEPTPPPPPPVTQGNPPTFLVTVDQTTGQLTTIGEIVGYSPVRGLAYDAATDTLYGVADGSNPQGTLGGDVLLAIDRTTGAASEVGNTGFSLIGGIRFDADGVLYGGVNPVAAQQGVVAELITIDPTTGAGTDVGPTGAPGLSGLAFVPGGGPSVLEIPTLSWLGLALLGALLAVAALLALRRH
jgi:hypothetical protein